MTPGRQADVERAGRTVFPAFELHVLSRVRSTQDAVRDAAAAGAPAGYCVVADEQVAGRGRQGRTWVTAPGSALLVSLLLRERAAVAPGVPIAAGLAVRAAVGDLGVPGARLKWPNDVLADGRKLAGILCEVEPRANEDGVAVALGVGVNLMAVPAGVLNATDLASWMGGTPDAADVLVPLLTALGERLARLRAGGVPALREEWEACAHGLGEVVTARSGGAVVRGTAVGLDDDGALLVREGATIHRLVAGDVHLERDSTEGRTTP